MNGGKSPTPCDLPPGAAFHESLAAGWSDAYARRSFRKRRSIILDLLAERVTPDQNWLDLGCGSGIFTLELLKLGARVTAVDGSPLMLAAARAALAEKSRVTLMQSDVAHLPSLSDDSFHGILCSSVIEYVETPDKLLAEAARVLRPGGRFILSLPPTWSPVRSLQKAARRLLAIVGKTAFSYLDASLLEINPKRIPRWLDESGFTVDRVIGFDPLLGNARGSFRPALYVIDARKYDA